MKSNLLLIGIMVVAVFFGIAVSTVVAQQFTPRTPESRVEEIDKAVTLTADQKAQILKLYTDAAANREQGGRGFGGGGTTAALEKILTPDQVKKYAAYTLQQSVDRRITQIDEAVTLTADQRQKIVPVLEKEITAQNTMMAEMRGQGQNADFQGMMEKRQALRDETDKALASILTKEQMTKYSAMPRFGRGGRGGN